MRSRKKYPISWREYQAKLKRTARLRRLPLKMALIIIILGAFFGGLSLWYFDDSSPARHSSQPTEKPQPTVKKLNLWPENLSRGELSDYLTRCTNGFSANIDSLVYENGGVRFRIETTLDVDLQKYIVRLLRRSRTLQAAVVVLDPFDGRVLAMASRDTYGRGDNLCLKADFPAASLFKIISAAAALEAAGYTPDKTLFYKGNRHTLYKYQLKQSKGRHSASTNLRKAFATSNNSVFGKIGIYTLGQKVMAEYAGKFFFNKPIPFDLPLDISTIEVPADEFGLAEIASGFNKKTLLSPLHAALLSAMIVRNGNIAAPRLISTIADETDKIIYRAPYVVLNSPINASTTGDLKALMQYAARYGTTRSAFRKLRRQRVFGDYTLGAKTGTINDKLDRFKYDWITAFALTPDSDNGICIAVLAVHGEKLGTRSTELTRALIKYYFDS
jgi:cell division protein FtsI/penicillin-binding protein 2